MEKKQPSISVSMVVTRKGTLAMQNIASHLSNNIGILSYTTYLKGLTANVAVLYIIYVPDHT
jgi:hypothetical protein